jgi:hypothetical protein
MDVDGSGQVRGMPASDQPRPDSAVPGLEDQPSNRPIDAMVESEPLGEEEVVLENENAGVTQSRGGGEFPDPDTPPSGMAPANGSPPRGRGTFDEAYASVDEETRASGAERRP